MVARASHEARAELRRALYERIDRGTIGLREAVRMMRKASGKSQASYAALVGVSPRVLIDFERGAGNPTIASLEKVLRPFGLELSVRRQAPMDAGDALPLRFTVRDAHGAVIGHAATKHAAIVIARERANKTGGDHAIRDEKRGATVAKAERSRRRSP